MSDRPQFKNIKNYQEFSKYYWYRDELKQICKELKIDYSGMKIELNHNIEEYFNGNLIEKNIVKKFKKKTDILTLNTKLLECGFVFNQKFRDFFSEQTGITNFKFNADMVATSKKVKLDQDESFTLGDMLNIFYGKLEYAKYDKSSCQWNQFLKDFSKDNDNEIFTNKFAVATILWKAVRSSTKEKIYTNTLIKENYDMIKKYIKD